jgi:erythromycin esterase
VKLLLLGLVIATCACKSSRSDEPPAARDHAPPTIRDRDPRIVPLRTRDPRDEELSDLAPLRSVLANVRIVQLGEQTHGDGAAFEAKVRLVKFLHRELGFSVLAFESGLYDCAKAWERIRAGDDATVAARSAIFPLWSASQQVQPLWDYLGAQARTAHPLELAGFDSQFTGEYSARDLVGELAAVTGDRAAAEPLRALFAGVETTKPQRDKQRAAIAQLSRKLSGPDAAFWKHVLRSAAEQVDAQDAGLSLTAASNNRRDRQMAENLLWLATEKHPDKKIIVWGATTHLMRNAETLEETGLLGRSKAFEGYATMGHHVSKRLGDAVYTIGFLANEGSWRWATNAAFAGTIEPAPEGSFEALFVRAGVENAFLDLRRAGEVRLDLRGDDASAGTATSADLRTPRVARPCGYEEMTGDWSQVVDGFVFTNTMTPSDPVR